MRDLRPRTREAYLSYVVLLGKHYAMDPAGLTEAQVRDYFLFLRNERQPMARIGELGRAPARSSCLSR